MRGIEHGNLLDDESVELFCEHDAFLTMNLVTYWALQEEGRELGLSQANWDKVSAVLDNGMNALRKAYDAGVNLTYGTDLLGGMQRHQAREFAIRAKVMPAIEVIRSATVTAAKLLQREDELGVIAPRGRRRLRADRHRSPRRHRRAGRNALEHRDPRRRHRQAVLEPALPRGLSSFMGFTSMTSERAVFSRAVVT